MAASINEFLSKKLKAIKGSVVRDLFIGKFLSSYYEPNDTDNEKVNKIKSLFKIDGLLRVVGSETGFVGYINWSGNNAKYHNQTTRSSGVKVSKNGSSFDLLNDSGLNCKGDCEIIGVVNTDSTSYNDDPAVYPPRINSCKAYVKYKSSVYNNTTECKLKLNNSDQILGSVPAKDDELIIDTGNLCSSYSFESGIYTRFTPSITNEEGTLIGDYLDVSLGVAQYSFKYGTTIENAFNSSNYVTVYVNNYDEGSNFAPFRDPNDYNTGTSFYNNSSLTNYSSFGYYMDDDNKWYYFNYDTLLDQTIVSSTGIYQEPVQSSKPYIVPSIESESITISVQNESFIFNVSQQETSPYYNKMASISFDFQVPDYISYMRFVLVSPDDTEYLIEEYYNYDNIGWSNVTRYISGLTLNDNEVWRIRLLNY